MNKLIKNRKGATLAELMIVLAVIVIAAGMVVTFSSMMHGAQGVSNARYEALQDVKVAEALIEGFIEKCAEDGVTLVDKKPGETDPDGNIYIDGEETPAIYFHATVFKVGENEVKFLENIDSITFDIDSAGNDTLYYCTINYSVSNTDYTYTFCVNPYIGEGGN